MEEQFTWVPFYKELAEKLLTYKNNRKELVEKVYSIGEKYTKYIYSDDGSHYKDLDPFSIFGIFNRGITETNKKFICSRLKELFEIKANIPEDFDSIPTVNNLMSIFVWREQKNDDFKNLWDLFELVLNENYDKNKFCKYFDLVRTQDGIKWNITMALYWVKPDNFMPLDENSRNYLTKIGIPIMKDTELYGATYLELLESIKIQISNKKIKEKSYTELSYNAWKNGDKQGDSEIMKNVDCTKYINLLKKNKNIILHGAPGTGKTYLAKQIANEMGCSDENIGFVQFHPSYDYTDFVEGLRPTSKDDNGNILFERKNGVFKEFCNKAFFSKSVESNEIKLINDSPTIWKVSLEGTGDNETRRDCMENGWIRIGWSEYGDVEDFDDFEDFHQGGKYILRTFQHKMQIGDIVLSCYSASEIDAIGVVTGEYEYREEGKGYSRYRNVKWLVKGIRENIVELNHGTKFTLSTVYKLQIPIESVLEIVKKYSDSKQNVAPNQPFVFVIDEINRGELSKIFGELFFSIDPGYRGKKGKVKTQYQNLIEPSDTFASGFYIPENVYIIGTMNDIDRSVESMDFAMRRRFAFIEVTAEESADNMGLSEKSRNKMNAINQEIDKIDGLNKSYNIGGAYFIDVDNVAEKERRSAYDDLWEYILEGLIREYLRGIMAPDEQDETLNNIKSAYDNAE